MILRLFVHDYLILEDMQWVLRTEPSICNITIVRCEYEWKN